MKIPRASENEVPFKCQCFSLKFIFLNTEESLICSTFHALITSIIYIYIKQKYCDVYNVFYSQWQHVSAAIVAIFRVILLQESNVQIKNYNIEIAAET